MNFFVVNRIHKLSCPSLSERSIYRIGEAKNYEPSNKHPFPLPLRRPHSALLIEPNQQIKKELIRYLWGEKKN